MKHFSYLGPDNTSWAWWTSFSLETLKKITKPYYNMVYNNTQLIY